MYYLDWYNLAASHVVAHMTTSLTTKLSPIKFDAKHTHGHVHSLNSCVFVLQKIT